METELQFLTNIPRFSLAARLICMRLVLDLEKEAERVEEGIVQKSSESAFYFSEKRHALTLIVNYLLDPDSAVSEAEFLELLKKFKGIG